MPDEPTAEESRRRLEALGWSVRVRNDKGSSAWVAFVTWGGAACSAVGDTEAEALGRALGWVEGLGMPPRRG